MEKQKKRKNLSKEEIFQMLRKESDERMVYFRKMMGGVYNRRTTKYLLFPFLMEKANIYSYERLEEENKLIEEKKSPRTKVVRNAIEHLYAYIEQYFETQNEM